MIRFIGFIVLLVVVSSSARAQVEVTPAPGADTMKLITIVNANRIRSEHVDTTKDLQILAGQVHLIQEKTHFYCDSAVIDKKLRTVRAFGKIHINDADSIHTYSDFLLYHIDTKIATLTRNAKLTDGKSTLLTDSLQYDANQKIGQYYNGGKVLNNKTVLTSKEATYYGELKDVYFKKNVVLVDPKYNLKTDSLLYNTDNEMATFITKTFIEDSLKRNITTSEGFYDLRNRTASFGKRPTIVDKKAGTKTTADIIDTDDATGITKLIGRAVHIDTIQHISMLANYIEVNRTEETLFATQKPLLILIQEKDTIYVTADTLFSGKLSKLKMKVDSAALLNSSKDSATGFALLKDSANIGARKNAGSFVRLKEAGLPGAGKTNDSARVIKDSAGITIDSLHLAKLKDSAAITMLKDSSMIARVSDSVKARKDSLHMATVKDSSTLVKALTAGKLAPQKDTTVAKIDTLKGAVTLNINDLKNTSPSTPTKPAINQKGTPKSTAGQKNQQAGKNQSAATDTTAKSDSTDRYFQGYHHVRIFSDSLQAVSDSMFYSAKDSIFKLFTNPIAWANGSQITGDTIYMYTKDRKPKQLYVFENSFAINKVGKDMFNQLKGNRMYGNFTDGNIDNIRAKGSAESVYYIMDEDSSLIGVNKVVSDIIELRFVNKELNKVVAISEPTATMYPARQVPESDKLLRNFKWLEAKRPKSKFELFGD